MVSLALIAWANLWDRDPPPGASGILLALGLSLVASGCGAAHGSSETPSPSASAAPSPSPAPSASPASSVPRPAIAWGPGTTGAGASYVQRYLDHCRTRERDPAAPLAGPYAR